MFLEYFGFVGAFTLTLMNTPLVYEVCYKRSQPPPPKTFLFLSFATSVCFIVFSFSIDIWSRSLPILVSNSVALICTLSLILFKMIRCNELKSIRDVKSNREVVL